MEKEKRTSAFLLWLLKAVGIFVGSADGTGYVINPKFIQCGYAVSQAGGAVSVTYPAGEFNNTPTVVVFPVSSDLGQATVQREYTDLSNKAGFTARAFYVGALAGNVGLQWFAIDPDFVFKRVFGGGGGFLESFMRVCAWIGGGQYEC